MKNLDALKELIKNTTFDLDIVEYTDYHTTLLLTTAKCKSGLFLKIRIYETDMLYLVADLCYGDDSYRKIEKFSAYYTEVIMDVLSNVISNTCTVSNNIGAGISRLETNILLAPSVDWVEIFKDGLFNIFKDVDIDRTEYLTVHLIGIDLIVEFDDDTHAFSVKVAQTTNPDNNKAVLIGVVCDNNYNQVLVSVRTVYNNIKEQYSNLEYLSQKIMWGR